MGRAAIWFALIVASGLCAVAVALAAAPTPDGGPAIGALVPSAHWRVLLLSDLGPGQTPDEYGAVGFTTPQLGWLVMSRPSAGDASTRLYRTRDGGASWTALSQVGNLMCFATAQVGWSAWNDLDKSHVGQTTDGGASWRWRDLVDREIYALTAVSESEAWAVSTPHSHRTESTAWERGQEPDAVSLLLHTQDGGRQWTPVSYPSLDSQRAELEAVLFRDRQHGWIVASPSGTDAGRLFVLRTEDGGRSFERAFTPIVRFGGGYQWRIRFPSQTEGWVAFSGDSLLHTADGGRTWAKVVPAAGALGRLHVTDCAFPTPRVGWAVGSIGGKEAYAARTDDGGQTWVRVETGAEQVKCSVLEQVTAVDAAHAWVVGRGGYVESDMPPRTEHLMRFVFSYLP